MGSGRRRGWGAGVVVFHFLPRRLAPLDPMLAHEPLDAVAADLDPAPAQRDVQLAVAVGLEVLGVGLADRRDKPRHGSARADRRPVDRRLWPAGLPVADHAAVGELGLLGDVILGGVAADLPAAGRWGRAWRAERRPSVPARGACGARS